MEVIQDELQKNNVRIDIETLTEHMGYILEQLQRFLHACGRPFDSRRITTGCFSRNGCKQSRACHVLLDTYLPCES